MLAVSYHVVSKQTSSGTRLLQVSWVWAGQIRFLQASLIGIFRVDFSSFNWEVTIWITSVSCEIFIKMNYNLSV